MSHSMYIVDAFTGEPFHGNPAAICVMAETKDDDWMAAVAREMNLSETAFVERHGDDWKLRWFTPAVEVDLCGHATLASAHALWTEGHTEGSTAPLRFHTRSGMLTARSTAAGIVLDFPAAPALIAEPDTIPAALLGGLRVRKPVAVARNQWDWLVELEDAAAVRALQPDMAELATVRARGVIVTARGDDGVHDFVSRWFGPQSGVPEDPVTGSSHCCLGPWWRERIGRAELRGWQASARGGAVAVRVIGGRVELMGHAVTVLRGTLLA